MNKAKLVLVHKIVFILPGTILAWFYWTWNSYYEFRTSTSINQCWSNNWLYQLHILSTHHKRWFKWFKKTHFATYLDKFNKIYRFFNGFRSNFSTFSKFLVKFLFPKFIFFFIESTNCFWCTHLRTINKMKKLIYKMYQ